LKLTKDSIWYFMQIEAFQRSPDEQILANRAAEYLISAYEVVENLKREQIVLGINVQVRNNLLLSKLTI